MSQKGSSVYSLTLFNWSCCKLILQVISSNALCRSPARAEVLHLQQISFIALDPHPQGGHWGSLLSSKVDGGAWSAWAGAHNLCTLTYDCTGLITQACSRCSKTVCFCGRVWRHFRKAEIIPLRQGPPWSSILHCCYQGGWPILINTALCRKVPCCMSLLPTGCIYKKYVTSKWESVWAIPLVQPVGDWPMMDK